MCYVLCCGFEIDLELDIAEQQGTTCPDCYRHEGIYPRGIRTHVEGTGGRRNIFFKSCDGILSTDYRGPTPS